MCGNTAHVRKIIHLDMDAFFASVEQRDDPALRGRPVVVGGPANSRGVVCAASYEARVFGVRSAMPCSQAHRLCPQAAFVPPDFERYSAASAQIMAVLRSATPLVEPLSLDEAYLDVTSNSRHEPCATTLARSLRREIRAATGLTASAGVGASKFVAKCASDADKPDGLTIVPPWRQLPFIHALPVGAAPGVGAVTAPKLHAAGFRTFADLASAGHERVAAAVGGRLAGWLLRLAEGADDREVEPYHERLSVGIEDTFPRDLWLREDLLRELANLAGGLERRLTAQRLNAGSLTLKVKDHRFHQVTRTRRLRAPLAGAAHAAALAADLLPSAWDGTTAVRLLGLSAGELTADDGLRQELIWARDEDFRGGLKPADRAG
jgi:DNA polymerase-4